MKQLLIYLKGKIEGLEEARWQIVYALPHIDPNGKLEKQTSFLMDAMKEEQDKLNNTLTQLLMKFELKDLKEIAADLSHEKSIYEKKLKELKNENKNL